MTITLKTHLALALALLCASCQPKEIASCKTPLAGWRDVSHGLPELAIVNKVTVMDGKIRWNSKEITRETLRDFLRRSSTEEQPPFILLAYSSNSDCDEFLRIRKIVADNYGCQQGRCGQIHAT
jgi:hypothetical protein